MDGSKEHALFDTASSQIFHFGHRHPSREPSRYRAVFGLGGELGFFLPFHSRLASPPVASSRHDSLEPPYTDVIILETNE